MQSRIAADINQHCSTGFGDGQVGSVFQLVYPPGIIKNKNGKALGSLMREHAVALDYAFLCYNASAK